MASSAEAYNSTHHAQIEPNDHGDTNPSSPPFFRPWSRRISSFSSSPSLSSNSSSNGSFSFPDDSSPFSPSTTPLRRFSGVPFSWEQIPGKPKNEIAKKKELSALSDLLPLPPAGSCSSNNNSFRKGSKEVMDNIISPKKHNASESFRKDPFFAALMECSKDDHQHCGDVISNFWKGSKVPSKTLSDRFGFINMYASCKRTCAVSESIVFLPRSRPYSLINRR